MFAEYAPHYWAKGMPVIPLRPHMKVPAINAWSQYANKMPTEETQAAWLDAYGDGNIGLPLGSQSSVVGLDLDTDDPTVLALLERLMPVTPWKRVGKKGAVFAFRYNGEKTYRIRDEEGATILELLSGGTQVVLPPSIHPDTGRSYVATGELWEMFEQLPTLPADFEQNVRDGLIELGFKLTTRGRAKVSEWTPSGGRDSAMISNAGILARAVMRGERSLVEALHEMEVWCASYVERVVGDPIDVDKGKAKIMEFVQRDLADGRHTLPTTWSRGMDAENIAKTKTVFGEDTEEWTAKQILDDIEEVFSELDPTDTSGRTMGIEMMLRRVARSPSLTEIDFDVICRYLSASNPKMTTIGSLRQRLRELKRDGLQGNDHSEIAEALLAELQRDGEVRFATTRFYRWGGSHWKELEEFEIHKALIREFGKLPAAKRASDHKGIVSVLSKMASKSLRPTEREVAGINFANGFLTPDLEMMPHGEDLGCTYVLPYRYVQDERPPAMWLGMLDQCWGEEPDYVERVEALREAIAATLFGVAHRYSRAFCLYGVAHSGKTTILNVIRGLIPTGASSSIAPDVWNDKFLVTMMEGKLINFCGELSESKLINGASFKTVVEGAAMPGQFKGKDIFEFKPNCAQWFAGNFPPRSRDTSDGFGRRWLFWTFNKKVTTAQKREGLEEEILAEEREAIVAWAAPSIQALMRRSDFALPPSHHGVEMQVANQNNSVRQFVTSGGLVMGGPQVTDETPMFLAYYNYCRILARCEPVSRTRFRIFMMGLQSNFGFKVVIAPQPDGSEKVTYVGLAVSSTRQVA